MAMIWIVLALVAACLIGFVVYKHFERKEAENDNLRAQEAKAAAAYDPVAERESAIVAVAKTSRLSGVSQLTNIDVTIGKCVEVHEALMMVTSAELEQLHTVPGDFERHIKKHLPEYVSKYAQLAGAMKEEGNRKMFESSLEQLNTEIDNILSAIRDKNFTAFKTQSRFMELRFSGNF